MKFSKFDSEMSRAKGHGSAHEGTHHWMHQRLTAIANLPLVIWLIWSVASLNGATHAEFTAWLAQPWNAVLMILLIISVFYHAVLGAQVIIEDYIHCGWFKMLKLIGNKLFFFALGIACIFSILKIAL